MRLLSALLIMMISIQSGFSQRPALPSQTSQQLASISAGYQRRAVFLEKSSTQLTCERYTRMEYIGIGVTATGAALIGTSVALFVASHGQYENEGMIKGGFGCVALGILGLGAGVTTTIIGAKWRKYYCHKAKTQTQETGLLLQPADSGIGLALKF